LHADIVALSFNNHVIEVDKRFFVPLIRPKAKRVSPWPIGKVRERTHVIGTSLTKSPDSYNAHAHLRGLPQSFWHPLPVFIPVHDRDVRADETKGLSVHHETGAPRLHESFDRSWSLALRSTARKQKSRAHNNCEHGY
jgi:hypothetical protein